MFICNKKTTSAFSKIVIGYQSNTLKKKECFMFILDRFRQLPKWMIACQILSKVVAGIGFGVLLAHYLHGLGWWLILASLIAAIPAKFKMIDAYRTMSNTAIMLSGFAAMLFGLGFGLLLITKLQPYGWWLILAAFALAIPGIYKILFNK